MLRLRGAKNPSDFEDELEKKADSQTVTDIESRQQAVEVLISQKADKDSVTKSFVEIEKAKAYADTVKKKRWKMRTYHLKIGSKL